MSASSRKRLRSSLSPEDADMDGRSASAAAAPPAVRARSDAGGAWAENSLSPSPFGVSSGLAHLTLSSGLPPRAPRGPDALGAVLAPLPVLAPAPSSLGAAPNDVWVISLKVLSSTPGRTVVGAAVADFSTDFVLALVAFEWAVLEAAGAGAGGAVNVAARAAFGAALASAARLAAEVGGGRGAALSPTSGAALGDTDALRRLWVSLRNAAAPAAAMAHSDFRWACGRGEDAEAATASAAGGGASTARVASVGATADASAGADPFPAPANAPVPQMAVFGRGAGGLTGGSLLSTAALMAIPCVAVPTARDGAGGGPSAALLESLRDGANVRADAPGRSALLRMIGALGR